MLKSMALFVVKRGQVARWLLAKSDDLTGIEEEYLATCKI